MKEFEILGVKMHQAHMKEIINKVSDAISNKKRLVFCWNNPGNYLSGTRE